MALPRNLIAVTPRQRLILRMAVRHVAENLGDVNEAFESPRNRKVLYVDRIERRKLQIREVWRLERHLKP